MKIIKHGRSYRIFGSEYDPEIRIFKCKSCGCVFEAEKTEYEIKLAIDTPPATKESIRDAFIKNKNIYICKCPECDRLTRSNDSWGQMETNSERPGSK